MTGRAYFFAPAAALGLLFLCAPPAFPQSKGKIAGFGSSVCNGSGDEMQRGGYFGRFRDLLTTRGWEVVNVSRGGDNTVSIHDRWERTASPPMRPVKDGQYLLPQSPDYVLVGLSLANEGIRKDEARARDSVAAQFRSGLRGIIDRCRDAGMTVAVANCYPHAAYTPEQYRAIKQMNLEIQGWDVPSVNLLGAIDDGEGHWTRGFYHDEGHPNAGGHREMSFAIVPTLFEALKNRLPPPAPPAGNAHAETNRGVGSGFGYAADDTIHSFAVSFRVRTDSDAVLLRLSGLAAVLDSFLVSTDKGPFAVHNIGPAPAAVSAEVRLVAGSLAYTSVDGGTRRARLPRAGSWLRLTLSHRCAKGETRIYVDEQCVAVIDERLLLQRVEFLPEGAAECDDIMVFRSALTPEEIAGLAAGHLLQSSLEIYAPLDDKHFTPGSAVENRAQSLSRLVVGDHVRPAPDRR